MRNPDRIKITLALIEKIWTAHPDLRLMQLLGNCFPSLYDPYHVEDYELYKKLENTYLTEGGG